jgi:phosphopantetheine adenylyltransferase
MRTMVRTLVGFGLVALLAGPALAQGQGRGFGMMGGGGLAGLIGNSGVQKELKLDDKQVEKAKEYAASAREKMAENREKLQGLEGEERRTKQQELTKEANDAALKAFGEFLKPEQIARLKQINHQVRGARAFTDPEVIAKLNITDSQKSDIQAILQESMEGMRGLFSQDQSPEERAAGMKKMAELNKETLGKAEKKLNDEQQKTWKELIGAPFEFKPDPRPNN